jgi:hypothetical protein
MATKRRAMPRVEYVIVVGPEVVGLFDSKDDAEEWAEAYIDDNANYKGYLQPPRWYVASFTDARGYEREAEPGAPRSPYAREGRGGAHPRRLR